MTDVISDPAPEEAPAPAEEAAPVEAVDEVVPDLEVIAPEDQAPFVIGEEDGRPVTVRVNRLRTREFLALMRCLARGLGSGMGDLDFSKDEDEMQGELVAIMLMAIPEAAEEFIDFFRKVTVSVSGSDGDEKLVALALRNPALEDTLELASRVAVQEAPDLSKLLGKAQVMWKTVTATYAKRKA